MVTISPIPREDSHVAQQLLDLVPVQRARELVLAGQRALETLQRCLSPTCFSFASNSIFLSREAEAKIRAVVVVRELRPGSQKE